MEMRIMDAERKYYRDLAKKSLKGDFEKILSETKMTEEEEIVVRLVIEKGASTVSVAMKTCTSERTVCRIMCEFYDRVRAIMERK